MGINLGEVYHASVNCWHPYEIKGREVKMIYSQDFKGLECEEIYEVYLRLLASEHPDCEITNGGFFYGPDFKRYVDLWIKVGIAYRQLGFYHFVTQMGEQAPETK